MLAWTNAARLTADHSPNSSRQAAAQRGHHSQTPSELVDAVVVAVVVQKKNIFICSSPPGYDMFLPVHRI
jgi:hypothetical protein